MNLWKTKGIILESLDGKLLIFKSDYSKDELKKFLKQDYCFLCGKSQCRATCKLFSRETEDRPCLLMTKIIDNFFLTTSNFVNSDNQYQVKNYLNSIIALVSIIKLSEEWKADLFTDWGNWYYRGVHTKIHKYNVKYLLRFVTDLINNYDFLDKDFEKKYLTLVEGNSEEIFFNSINHNLSFHFLLGSKIINLKGKDSTKKENLRILLRELREKRNDFFIFLDGMDRDTKKYKEDLVREGLIKDTHFILWKKEFEDTLPLDLIYKSLQIILKDALKFTFEDLKTEINKGKSAMKSIADLSYTNNMQIDIEELKTKISTEVAKLIKKDDKCELINVFDSIDKIVEKEKDEYYFEDSAKVVKQT